MSYPDNDKHKEEEERIFFRRIKKTFLFAFEGWKRVTDRLPAVGSCEGITDVVINL